MSLGDRDKLYGDVTTSAADEIPLGIISAPALSSLLYAPFGSSGGYRASRSFGAGDPGNGTAA